MAVAPLRKIFKTPYWIFYAAWSALFLGIGAWAGVLAAGWIPADGLLKPEEPEANVKAVDLPANGQRNILLIGVDGLERDVPVLESLWLVLYFPGRSPVTLMPLYPRPGEPDGRPEASLLEAFNLGRTGEPSPAFFDHLRREQVWWNGYVLLDETAVAALLDHLGGVVLEGEHLNGLQALSGIPRAAGDRNGSAAGQVRLLRTACTQAGALPAGWPEIVRLAGELDDHLDTDLDLPQLVQDWLKAAGPAPLLECEFPLVETP